MTGHFCGSVVIAGGEPVLISQLRWDWCDVNTTCLVQFWRGGSVGHRTYFIAPHVSCLQGQDKAKSEQKMMFHGVLCRAGIVWNVSIFVPIQIYKIYKTKSARLLLNTKMQRPQCNTFEKSDANRPQHNGSVSRGHLKVMHACCRRGFWVTALLRFSFRCLFCPANRFNAKPHVWEAEKWLKQQINYQIIGN